MTIGKKLTISFAAVLVLSVAMGASSLISTAKFSRALDNSIQNVAKRLELAGSMRTSAASMWTHQRGLVMYTLVKQPDIARENDKQFRAEARQLQSQIDEFRPIMTENGRESLAAIQSSLTAWLQFYDQLAQDVANAKRERLLPLLKQGAVCGDQVFEATAKLLELQRGS
ncbi:MAG: MCP four helix bundle domain-containing protein, partial [Acidobacteriia bacterium]|nr:MCP four helix bundle domain-containing protein [Terriglobia bacterium]